MCIVLVLLIDTQMIFCSQILPNFSFCVLLSTVLFVRIGILFYFFLEIIKEGENFFFFTTAIWIFRAFSISSMYNGILMVWFFLYLEIICYFVILGIILFLLINYSQLHLKRNQNNKKTEKWWNHVGWCNCEMNHCYCIIFQESIKEV